MPIEYSPITLILIIVSMSFQIPKLHIYESFCGNQVFGKAVLDEKKNDPAVEDFLQRCQESPFSRKLDLWGLLGR